MKIFNDNNNEEYVLLEKSDFLKLKAKAETANTDNTISIKPLVLCNILHVILTLPDDVNITHITFNHNKATANIHIMRHTGDIRGSRLIDTDVAIPISELNKRLVVGTIIDKYFLQYLL